MSTYNHQPFVLGEQSFRLFKLNYSSSETTPLSISFRNFSLSYGCFPKFKALSYTWGPPEPSEVVNIDDESLNIRQNLHHFLRRARTDKDFCKDTWLWVDQLCIDQSKIEERNHQVNQMSMIYQEAHEVIIWLGRGWKGSDYFMDIVKTWSKDPSHSVRSRISPIVASAVVKDAKRLSQLQYWRRLWIRQEIILAQKLTVRFGIWEMDWTHLFEFSEDIASSTFDKQYKLRSSSLLRCIAPLHDQWKAKNTRHWLGMGWPQALAMSKDTLCEDIRDKAYGMLGLLQANHDISADYTRSVVDLCLLIISTYIEAGQEWPRINGTGGCALLVKLCRQTFQVPQLTDEVLRRHLHDQVVLQQGIFGRLDLQDSESRSTLQLSGAT